MHGRGIRQKQSKAASKKQLTNVKEIDLWTLKNFAIDYKSDLGTCPLGTVTANFQFGVKHISKSHSHTSS